MFYLSKEKLSVENWQVTVVDKYPEKEFIELVNEMEELIFEHDFKKSEYKFYRKAVSTSKQNPEYYFELLFLNGFIELSFPDRFKEEFFQLIHKICNQTGLKFFRGDYNKNLYEEIPIEEYQYFLNQDFTPIQETKFSDKEVGIEYRWLSIKTTDKQSVIDFFQLKAAEVVDWDEATDKIYGTRVMIVEKDDCVTLVGSTLPLVKKFLDFENLSHTQQFTRFVEHLSKTFGLVGYFMLTYKYGSGEMYIANDGELKYGRFWGDGDLEVLGNPKFISNYFFKGELDISKNLFTDVQSFNRYEPLKENIRLYSVD